MSESANAMTQLVELRERAAVRLARVEELEAQHRLAVQTHQQASATLIEYERTGGTAADRKRLETALATARAEAEAPWDERIEGARRASRDADHQVRLFATANLTEVSNSDADTVVRAARELIQSGGEQGPQLRRDRYPALVQQDVVERAVA